MSNESNNTFFPRLRRAWIERRAAATGKINRQTVATVFGVSVSQVSADIRTLLQEHPDCLQYDLTAKEYVWKAGTTVKTQMPDPVIELRLMYPTEHLPFPPARPNHPAMDDGVFPRD